MSDILYMYVFCLKNPSDVARSRFIAVVMLKVDTKEKKKKKVRREGSWKLPTTWLEIVAVLIVFPKRRLKLCEVENIVT